MITARYTNYQLQFKQPSGTSRGVLTHKETWFLILQNDATQGIGECALFRGLSVDDRPDYEAQLRWVCDHIHLGLESLRKTLIRFPSIVFGLETAFKSLENNGSFVLYPSAFTQGNDRIPINGLVWMGDKSFMKKQIKSKINAGFKCLKLKIGALDFDTEIALLKSIRKTYTQTDLELRVDANGAFSPKDALEKIKRLSDWDLHSIEQPVKQGQLEVMAQLCRETPLPIALDEELIGVFYDTEKQHLLQDLKPQYIILKPSLIGGFTSCDSWIRLAEKNDIGWWITSALESNIGLSALAQYTYLKKINNRAQGLGTGGLFTNNFETFLSVQKGQLSYCETAMTQEKFLKTATLLK